MAMNFELSLALQGADVELPPASKWVVEIDTLATIATLGLSLAQAKAILVKLQAEVVEQQISLLAGRQRPCAHCGSIRKVKDYHDIHYRSLFGDVVARMPR